jgi:hypothetical protein
VTARAQSQREGWRAWVGWVLSAAPAVLLVVQMGEALLLRWHLGHWPVVYRDDPQSLLLKGYEYGVVFPCLYAALFGIPLWCLFTLFVALPAPRMRARVVPQLVLLVAAVGSLALFYRFDPTGYIDWFLD